MALTLCLDCRARIPIPVHAPYGARCPRCARAYRIKRAASGGAWDVLRRRVLMRDGGCVLPPPHDGPLEVDHIIPIIDGGRSSMTNLRTLCRAHHRGR